MCLLRGCAATELSVIATLHRHKLTLHALGGIAIGATITELMHADRSKRHEPAGAPHRPRLAGLI
jgi:hypothetical protein